MKAIRELLRDRYRMQDLKSILRGLFKGLVILLFASNGITLMHGATPEIAEKVKKLIND